MRGTGGSFLVGSHIAENKDIIRLLVEGYDKPQVHALSCGLMLRECIKKDQLARLLTENEVSEHCVPLFSIPLPVMWCVGPCIPNFLGVDTSFARNSGCMADTLLQVLHLRAEPAVRYCCRRLHLVQGSAHFAQDSDCQLFGEELRASDGAVRRAAEVGELRDTAAVT